MTWVVAASTIFGYGAMYSDVQVTFDDGRTKDLVQKAYPISNFIAAGFAGSVQIGFMLLHSLSDFLQLPSEKLDQCAWDPVWVSTNWAAIAKSVYEQASEVEKELGSKFLIVGISPTESCGLGAKVYFTRFSSPNFTPGIMARAIKLCSIGSGAGITEYKRKIKPLFRITSGILQAEVGQEGGWARQLGFSISRILADKPHSGISRHIHTTIVRRGSIVVENNNETIYPEIGTPIVVEMPKVASSYDEFVTLANSSGHIATGSTC